MKVCFVLESAYTAFSDSNKIGGAEIQIKNFAERLGEERFRVYILTNQAQRIENIESREIGGNFFQRLGRIYQALKEVGPDLVITTIASKTTVLTSVVCKILGIKHVYRLAHDIESEGKTDRETGGPVFKRLLFRFMLAHLTEEIICQHSGQRDNLVRDNIKTEKVIIHNSFPIRDVPKIKKENCILWVGRFVKWKNPGIVLDLAERLPDKNFVMISPGITEDFKKMGEEYNNLKIIDYVPFEDMWEYFERAKLFINTSDAEGFPNTFIQAAMCKTPIVSLNVDPENLFEKHGHGFVCHSLDRMEKKIDELYKNDDLYEKCQKNAIGYAKRIHDIDKNVKTLVEMANNL
ncbi:MAG: glycosyltransferase family 4 protein [Nanoarchaeota archaeon]|nr:glycosyltransferase family 4 protein [Nanoarchaeota archaeon]